MRSVTDGTGLVTGVKIQINEVGKNEKSCTFVKLKPSNVSLKKSKNGFTEYILKEKEISFSFKMYHI